MNDTEQSDESSIPSVVGTTGALVTGVPPELQRNLWKVLGRVLTAGAEWPAEWLEGKGRIARARADAKAASITSQQRSRELIDVESAKVAALRFDDPEQAQRAFNYHAAHIVGEQANRERVLEVAVDELKKLPGPGKEVSDIDDDWVSVFLKEASNRSNDDFRIFFGRILTGEIKKPGSFSFATVQSLGKLTKNIAETFQNACNIATFVTGDSAKIVDTFTLGAGSNGLEDYGMNYENLARLVEYGLLRPEFTEGYYLTELLNKHKKFIINHSKLQFLLMLDEGETLSEGSLLMKGPSFTQVGNELRSVVNIEENKAYVLKFADWFKSMKISVHKVDGILGGKVYGHKL